MLKELLRTIGTACLLTGAVFYFTGDLGSKQGDLTEQGQLQTELTTLQAKLKQTEEELASIQLALPNAESPEKEVPGTEPTTSVLKTTLHIEPGMHSTIVANTLVQSGIIDDAAMFESYLSENNLTGKIQIGKHELDSSMTIEKVAAIITNTH